MKKIVYLYLVLVFLAIISNRSEAQVVYGSYGQGSSFYVVAIDLTTCTSCTILELPGQAHFDISITPDGSIIVLNPGSEFTIYPAPNFSNPTVYSIDPAGITAGSLLFNGLIYIYAPNGLHYFDPATNLTVYVGPWPAGMPSSNFEFYEANGQVYAMQMGANPNEIWQIDLVDPTNSAFVQSISGTPSIASTTSTNIGIFFATNDWINNYDETTNTSAQVCQLSPLGIIGSLAGLTYLPAGAPAPPCLCTTDAGSILAGNAELCLSENAVIPHNSDETLDGDDVFQFIVFTDLTDTLGSIILTSNSPTIPFDPSIMQTGVTYYMAAIAGDGLNGNVDLNDDCLSVSNAFEVIWWPPPSVSFTAPNPDLCVGDCIVLNVILDGTAPFVLYGDILSGNTVIGTFNESYNSNNGTLEVCAPQGTSIGNLLVQATDLSDSQCTCE